MNARLMMARPMIDQTECRTPRRGPYLSNSAPMMGCIAPLMRKPTDPTHEMSERSQPNVGSISVTNKAEPLTARHGEEGDEEAGGDDVPPEIHRSGDRRCGFGSHTPPGVAGSVRR